MPDTTSIAINPSPNYTVNPLAAQVSLAVVPAYVSMQVLSSQVDLNSYTTAVVRISRTGPTDYGLEIKLERSGDALFGSEYVYSEPVVIPKGESYVDLVITPAFDWEPTSQVNLFVQPNLVPNAQSNLFVGGVTNELYAQTNLFVGS